MSWICNCLPCCGDDAVESEAAEQLIQNPAEDLQNEPHNFHRPPPIQNADLPRIDNEVLENNPGSSNQTNFQRLEFENLLDKVKEMREEVASISSFLNVPKKGKAFNEDNEDESEIDALNLPEIAEQVRRNENIHNFEPIAQQIIDYVQANFGREDDDIVQAATNVFNISGCHVTIGTMDNGADVQVEREPTSTAVERREYYETTLQQLNIPTEPNLENHEVARLISNHVQEHPSIEVSEERWRGLVGYFIFEAENSNETEVKGVYADSAATIRRVMNIPNLTKISPKENPQSVKREQLSPEQFREACEDMLVQIPGQENETIAVLKKLVELEQDKAEVEPNEWEDKYNQAKEEIKNQEKLSKEKAEAMKNQVKLLKEKEEAMKIQMTTPQTINTVIVEQVQETIRKELEEKMKEQHERTLSAIDDFRTNMLTEIMNKTQESITQQQDFFVEEQTKSFTSLSENMNGINTDIQETKDVIDKTTQKISESVAELRNEIGPLMESTKNEIAINTGTHKDLQTKQISEKLTTLHETIIKETENKIKAFQESLMNSIPGLINAASSSGESQYAFEKALENEYPKFENDELKKMQPDVNNYLSRLTRARGHLPPSATELEVSLQSIYCESQLNSFDLSDEMVKLKTTLKDCANLKPNEAQCERFTRLIPHGIIVALETKKPMKKEDALEARIDWGIFCDSLSHIPETKGLKLVRVIDAITEFATILQKDENEPIDGNLVTKCVDSSVDFCERLKDLYEDHKETYDIVDNYLAGLIKLANCMLFVNKHAESLEYLAKMDKVKDDSACLTDDMKKDWSNRIQKLKDQIAQQ